MADILRPLGYTTVDAPEGADMVIMNTCHIRERAEEKVFSVYVHGCNLKQVRINFAGVQNEVDSATGYLTTNIDGLLIKLSDASRKPINLNANQNNEFYSLGTNGLMNFHAAYHVVSGMASGLQAGVVKAVVSFNIDYQ